MALPGLSAFCYGWSSMQLNPAHAKAVDGIARVLHEESRVAARANVAELSRDVLTRAHDFMTVHAPGASSAEQQTLLRAAIERADISPGRRHALLTLVLGEVAGNDGVIPSPAQVAIHRRLRAKCEEQGVRYLSKLVFDSDFPSLAARRTIAESALAAGADCAINSRGKRVAGGGSLAIPPDELRF